MRITKDTQSLKRSLVSSKEGYILEQKNIAGEYTFFSREFINLEKIPAEKRLTLRYLQGKIDSIDDVIYLLDH